MIGFVLLLPGLALLGAAVAWRLGRRLTASGAAPPESVPASRDRDLLPESGSGDGKNGLAAFYAYQMAAGKIHRRQ